jgi:potassium/hydrogen antiporter
MSLAEPTATALALLATSAFIFGSAVASRFAARAGVPIVVLFLALGMAAGSQGVGGIEFEDYALTFRIGVVALVLILFDGGLNTPLAVFRRYATPAVLLATVGVIVTAGLVGVAARFAGLAWKEALLLGAIVSSTDAAAVFSVLRGGGVRTKERVAATLELESGLNDPMAIILTMTLVASIATATTPGASALGLVIMQLAIGLALGALVGFASQAVLLRFQLPAVGLYPLLTTALACLAFAVPTLLGGSGFLAVYVAAVGVGNTRLPQRSALLRVHDFLGWVGQVVMFIVLGLLASPSRLLEVAPEGLAIAAFLCLVARPIAVGLCLLPFRFTLRETGYVAWGGLKGAVPIVLAVMPVLAGLPAAARIFDIVFFVVLVSALVQGSTMRWLARRLHVSLPAIPPAAAVVEIHSTRPLGAELLTFEVGAPSAVCGVAIADIPFPPGSSAMLVVRGDELVAPRGDTELRAGDQVYVFCRVEDRGFFQLLFGRATE